MTFKLTIEGNMTEECFDFSVHKGSHAIPATFWPASLWNAETPPDQPPPLVLLQHGGPLHKRHEMVDPLARSIRDGTGSAVLLIDGPIHGKRRTELLEIMEMLTLFKRYWQDNAGIDSYVADWRTALDAVLDQGWADPGRIAWFGLSMGTAYGIPLCAAENRIRAAVMGMWGVDWGQQARLLANAQELRVPVLFQIKTEDQFFSTRGQRQLFDALGSPNKCLSTYEGSHSMSAPGQLDQLLDFVTRKVSGVQYGSSSTTPNSEATA
ncbi:MAG: alpha/beta hydrolase family protein [Thermomicrobiales bacterium]